MTGNGYYFAYGSNMNLRRMQARGMHVINSCSGTLRNHNLAFNKRAHNKVGVGYANIMEVEGALVQGVLYLLKHDEEILKMDPFEGYPERYDRVIKDIFLPHNGGSQPAWVYTATRDFIDDAVLPEREYVSHLLEGRRYLTDDYYQFILNTRLHGE